MSLQIPNQSAGLQGCYTLPLEFELEEDVEAELQHFVKLSRTGNYAAAHDFFNNTLRHHDHLFPVIVEYADMLLEQGCYGPAAEFLTGKIQSCHGLLDPEEIQLLKLMNCLSNIYSKGALRPALVEAKNAQDYLERTARQLFIVFERETLMDTPTNWKTYIRLFSDMQIHIFELYVSIMVLGSILSQRCEPKWVDSSWMDCPFVPPEMVSLLTVHMQSRKGIVNWYFMLVDAGMVWEASKILRAVLPIMENLPSRDADALLKYIPNRSEAQPDMWGMLMSTVYQAGFLLCDIYQQRTSLSVDFLPMCRTRLAEAEHIWEDMAAKESQPRNLRLDMEKANLEALESGDVLAAAGKLLDIVYEAHLRQDLRTEVLARLALLSYALHEPPDWRDLCSVFELYTFDCGNLLEYVHVWDIFAGWTLRDRERHLSCPSNLFSLLMSESPPPAPPNQIRRKWANFLCERMLLQPETPAEAKETFDPLRDDYVLQFDIPIRWSSYNLLDKRLSHVLNVTEITNDCISPVMYYSTLSIEKAWRTKLQCTAHIPTLLLPRYHCGT
ncbi:hypothetical protein BJX64DRAFT_291591 [Aspergillus heterothallicus]